MWSDFPLGLTDHMTGRSQATRLGGVRPRDGGESGHLTGRWKEAVPEGSGGRAVS